jgi:hypothetical protein
LFSPAILTPMSTRTSISSAYSSKSFPHNTVHYLSQPVTKDEESIFTKQIDLTTCFDLPPVSPTTPDRGPTRQRGSYHDPILISSLQHLPTTPIHPYPPTLKRKAISLNIARMHQLNRPLLISRDVWILRSEPKRFLEAHLMISSQLGDGIIEYVWAEKNGYVIFVCSGEGKEFLLAVPQRWTTTGASGKRWKRWWGKIKDYIHGLLVCL